MVFLIHVVLRSGAEIMSFRQTFREFIKETDTRDHWHCHMGGGIHGLHVDFMLRTSFWQDMTQCNLPILKTSRLFSGKAWPHYDPAFRKDTAASGLVDWSRMNLDLYNFHTRLAPHSQPSAASSPFPNSGSLSSNFCRSWNDGTCCWLFGQCRYHHCCEKCKGTILASTVFFVPPNRMISTLEQLLHLGTKASGVEAVTRLPKATSPLKVLMFARTKQFTI